ncbi:hypothetical protein ERJ75_000413900 [Trypanosoma vivax]|nr:hypothetical protein ERJ75_000412900 [Trypanosoma vivax]KAH8617098.1 hypothetical protein ERJ75_000413900 [Trypanosoma vivax]
MALLCLWLELERLPRKRMIERIGAISNQLSGAVNIVAERDMSEKDETYEFLEAHEVLRDMRRQPEVAQGLDA